MRRYRYEGVVNGQWTQGITFARSQDHARVRLEQRQVVVDSLEPLGKGSISGKEWLSFSQGMAGLLATGVPLKDAGDLWLADGSNHPVWTKVFQDVTAGIALSQALESQAKAPAMLVALVRMGEATGSLDEAFRQAAETLEEQQKLRSAVWGALAYPMIVVLVAALAMGVLFVYVLPIFSDLYSRYQTDLPWLTSQLMALLAGMRAYGLLMLITLGGIFLLTWNLLKHETWRLRWHRFLLRIPVLRKHLAAYQQIVFCQGMGQLLAAGVGLLEAIRITLPSLANLVWRRRLEACLAPIEQGASPAHCFTQEQVLPAKLGRMAMLGEEAGRLATTLKDLGRLEKNELDRRLAAHISMLEPLLIVGMALVIGVVLIALYLPMFDIVNLME